MYSVMPLPAHLSCQLIKRSRRAVARRRESYTRVVLQFELYDDTVILHVTCSRSGIRGVRLARTRAVPQKQSEILLFL